MYTLPFQVGLVYNKKVLYSYEVIISHKRGDTERNGRMRETVYKGKRYQEADYDVLKAVSASGMNFFRYFPQDKLLIVAETTAEKFSCKRFYPNMPQSFADEMVCDDDRTVFCEMYQAIDEGEKKATAVFKMKNGVTYVRVVLSVLEIDENGNAMIVVGMVEDVTDEIRKEKEQESKEKAFHNEQVRLTSINEALSSNFNNVYLVDIENGNARSYHISDVIRKEYGDMFYEGDYSALIQVYVRESVYDLDKVLFDHIIDTAHLEAAVREKGADTFNYRVIRNGKVQYFQCRAVKVEIEDRDYCIIAFRDINTEVSKELEQKTRLEEQMAVISGLSADYYSVMLVDYQKDTVRIQRAQEGDGKQIGDFFSGYSTWSEGVRAYTDTQVADDREAFYAAVSREGIMNHDEDYFFNYKKITDRGYMYLQFKVAYVDLGGGYRGAIVGTRNIDKETRREMEQKVQLKEALIKSERYKRAVLAEAIITYEINLSKNLIEEEMWEVIDGSRTELLRTAGMSAPANYDEFHKRWANKQISQEYKEAYEKYANREYLLGQFKEGHIESTFEFKGRLGAGREAYMRHTVFMAQDEESGDIIAYCNVKNITEQKIRELQMREYEQLLIVSAAYTYKGILQLELDTLLTRRLMIRNGEISVEDVGNWEKYVEHQIAFVHPDDAEQVADSLNIDRLRSMSVNERNICSYKSTKKNEAGNYRSFFTNTYMTEIEGRRYVILVTIDNTNAVERELQQKELIEDALARAEAANRAKTTFLSNMSHDIRTPMNAIIGFTTLATTHIDNKEQVQDYLGKIMSASNHLLSLINDVLDMSRIESGRMQLDEGECSLSEIMHGIRNILQVDMKSRRLNLYIDTVDVFDEKVICDKLRLNQILLNLLGNAVKFTEPGGSISVRICQKPAESKEYGKYVFCVKDTGIGMSKEFLKHIFEPFERERNSTVSGIQGTGLGMPITKNIVEMMGGSIKVNSRKGEGTEFIVELPMKKIAAEEVEIKVEELEGVHALVVDDDFNTCDSVSSMLIQIGMRAEWTMSGREAILRTRQAVSRNDEYRVYVIDWLVPDMNGIEIARQIRKEVGDDAPIIILTAYDWSDIEEEAKEAGVTAFCSKPLFISDLRRCLLSIVRPDAGKEKKEQPCREGIQGQRLLIVEDNDLNREIASEILSEAGFIVEEAEDGSIAVERLKEKGAGYYSLVLMDVQMPIMDGYTATRTIRAFEDQKLAGIPIIAMTANAFEEDKKKALEAGMNAHVAKPVDVEKLLDTLEKSL